jgi:hypothetical protein
MAFCVAVVLIVAPQATVVAHAKTVMHTMKMRRIESLLPKGYVCGFPLSLAPTLAAEYFPGVLASKRAPVTS